VSYSRFNSVLISTAAAALVLLASGCGDRAIESLEREELFEISFGKMEDQIDLFQVPGVPFDRSNEIYRKDGRIYISNGSSSKIMEFTPYGDLVFLLQNPEENPEPVVLSSEIQDEDITNRVARSFPFQNIGGLVVDSRKRLYVEDEVPVDQREIDGESGAVFYKRIFRFDRDGNFVDYLGQEGVGGAPFPFIHGFFVTSMDELVVITRLVERWIVFWYDPEGFLLYRVDIDPEQLPAHREDLASLEKVLPNFNRRELLITITYYEEEVNPSTQTRDAIDKRLSRIYRFDLEAQRYTDFIDVPDSGTRKEAIGGTEIEIPAPSYELLGNTLEGAFVFLRPEDFNRYELLVIDAGGDVQARRLLTIEDSEIFYKDLNLSEDGILSAMLCFQDRVRVVSWRSDRLIPVKTDGKTADRS